MPAGIAVPFNAPPANVLPTWPALASPVSSRNLATRLVVSETTLASPLAPASMPSVAVSSPSLNGSFLGKTSAVTPFTPPGIPNHPSVDRATALSTSAAANPTDGVGVFEILRARLSVV